MLIIQYFSFLFSVHSRAAFAISPRPSRSEEASSWVNVGGCSEFRHVCDSRRTERTQQCQIFQRAEITAKKKGYSRRESWWIYWIWTKLYPEIWCFRQHFFSEWVFLPGTLVKDQLISDFCLFLFTKAKGKQADWFKQLKPNTQA